MDWAARPGTPPLHTHTRSTRTNVLTYTHTHTKHTKHMHTYTHTHTKHTHTHTKHTHTHTHKVEDVLVRKAINTDFSAMFGENFLRMFFHICYLLANTTNTPLSLKQQQPPPRPTHFTTVHRASERRGRQAQAAQLLQHPLLFPHRLPQLRQG